MSLLQYQQRMQTAGLEDGGKEHGEVQTGAEFLVKHAVGKAHALPCLLIAGRRSRVYETFFAKGFIDSSHLSTGTVRVLRLVLVERGTAR